MAGAAHAQSGGWEFDAGGGIAQRRLVERTPAGAALVTESGPVLQLQLQAQRQLGSGGAIGLRASGTGGDIHYDGQTQAGAPLSTSTRHIEGGLDVLWRPAAPAAWGEAWLTAGWLGNRRHIMGPPTAGGLVETSQALLLGARWRSPQVAVRDWRVSFDAEARASAWHRLNVDYQGLLDNSTLRGAQRKQVVLRVNAAPPASAWLWTLEWNTLWQAASDPEPVYLGGALFGTVRQPELHVRDVALRLTRRF